MADVCVLEVRLHGRRIGALAQAPGDQISFSFDREYLQDPDRPTLGLSFFDVLGGAIAGTPALPGRLPPFFSNLLPEGALKAYLLALAGQEVAQEFDLIGILGRDLPGAVSVVPAGDFPVTGNRFRFSLAGARLKFPAIMDRAGELTVPGDGTGGSWIVKLPSGRFPGLIENEYAMLLLARAVGVQVPDARLVSLSEIAGLPDDLAVLGGNALAVRRFDRDRDGNPVHSEDFAQVLGVYPEQKYRCGSYHEIAEVLWAQTGAEGVACFIRRLVFNVLIGNTDMHLKNWSLVYPDGRQPALAPGYDFVSTVAYRPDVRLALILGQTRVLTELSLEQLSHLAARAGLPRRLVLDAGLEMVDRFRNVWGRARVARNLGSSTVDRIDALLQQTRLVHQAAVQV